MLVGGSPWVDRRVGDEALDEVVRKVLLTYWNTASFLVLYANACGWAPDAEADPAAADRPLLDRWVLADLHATVRDVDAALESFDSTSAGRRLTRFIDGLSNWYVRRSRRRFWQGDRAALATLHECLETLTRLMAPFVPFLTDHLWSTLVVSVDQKAVDSVHLADWPVADQAMIDETLLQQMALVQGIVELGRATRASSKVRIRQPLSRAVVIAPGFADLPAQLLAQVAEELNVLAVEAPTTDLVTASVKPNFRVLGRRFGPRTQEVAKAVAAADAPLDGVLTVHVDGEAIELSGDELIITETPREGWTVTTEGAMSVALDLELTDELRAAGLVRDALRFIQDSRKTLGLDITDRISLWWSAPSSAELAAALRSRIDFVADEVLAVSTAEGAPDDASLPAQVFEELGLTVWIERAAEHG
jgi:isoleucyl-tRNA synthetase